MAEHDDTPPEGPGEYCRFSRSDLAILRRAARECWGTPDVVRTEAIYQIAKLLTDPDTTPTLRLAVVKTLVTFDRSDQREDLIRLTKAKAVLDGIGATDAETTPRIMIPGSDGRHGPQDTG